MKKGINAWSFGNKTADEILKLAADAGFEGVEFALAENDGPVQLSSTEKELTELRKKAEAHGLALYSLASGLYWDYSITSDSAQERAKAEDIVKRQLECAKILGADTILVVPGAVHVSFSPKLGTVDYDVVYDRSLEAFSRLKKEAETIGVQIGLENVWNEFLLSPLEMRDFIDKIDSPFVGSYFDVGNVMYSGFPEQWIKILGKRIKKVHFKDFRRAVGTLDGFVDLLAGDVNYPAVVAALKAAGYESFVSGEMIPGYTYYGDTLIYNTSRAMDAILKGAN